MPPTFYAVSNIAYKSFLNLLRFRSFAAVASKSGLSKSDAESALAAVIDTITTEVSSGKKISMLGFGTFKSTFRSARTGRNPKTGEPLEIKAQWSPVFSASKTFKEKCNPPQ